MFKINLGIKKSQKCVIYVYVFSDINQLNREFLIISKTKQIFFYIILLSLTIINYQYNEKYNLFWKIQKWSFYLVKSIFRIPIMEYGKLFICIRTTQYSFEESSSIKFKLVKQVL